jgi:transcriptional regulator GlxA family with amidase domain
MPARRILVVAYPGCQSLDVAGPFEVFAGANRWAEAHGRARPYAPLLAAHGEVAIRTESGLLLQAERTLAAVRGAVDTLLVAGGGGADAASRDAVLVEAVRARARRARRVAGVCTGAFVLAAAGLLDGRRATTHWSACTALAARFPAVRVEPDPIWVRDGEVWTSAGVSAGIDLALALVEDDLGGDAALAIARWLVLFLRRPGNQRQFSAHLQGQLAERDALRRVQAFVAEHLGEDLGVERLAGLAAMSPRHFARRFRAETGTTPARWISRLRVETARRMLEEGRRPIEHVARDCGFGTPETLRRTFARQLATAPREYRRRFLAPSSGADVPTARRSPR